MNHIVILGATGIIGQTLANLIEERNFPFESIHLLSTQESKGKQQRINGVDYTCEPMETFDFSNANIIFGALDSEHSKYYQAKFPKEALYIDNSYAYRMDPNVPLVIPEINADIIQNSSIISNPNCTTIILGLPLYPLHKMWGLKNLVVSSYQSISGQGKKGIDTLYKDSKQFIGGQGGAFSISHKSLAFNLIPFIGDEEESLDSISTEEAKITNEIKKIFNFTQNVPIISTCVRVPTFIGHGVSVIATFDNPISVKEALKTWEKMDTVVQHTKSLMHLTPRSAQGEDAVFVGRVRQYNAHTLGFWVIGDNLRKGGALNAIQIAESYLQNLA